MSKNILFVGVTNELSDTSREKFSELTTTAISNGCGVHIFREDILFYDILRNQEGVKAIFSIDSASDKLLYGKEHEGFYLPTDKIVCERYHSFDIYNKAISRFPVPNKYCSFDKQEYDSRRKSVVEYRSRKAMLSIASEYKFVVLFQGSKDNNLINGFKGTSGDGKFIYTYDVNKNIAEFTVGGFMIPENDIIKCMKEVTQW